ncbi:hypothetical protein [Hyalangium rubrum]|uniref:Uncharacterized protein n=1 Tax=Hyalangium rubrum TaxID=3103134 RepID=A0ABU5GU75_9BACT|nr:hypothetical protein [Hyalangium sp. s54d21]MDY7224748.1 hypothetical protein [Hyalangium sp. s54d21]
MSGPGLNLPASDPRAVALRMVRPPAFFLLCVGVLAILFNTVGLILALLKVPSPFPPPPDQPPAVLEVTPALVLTILAGVTCGALSVWGAMSAMKLRGYGLATVGAIAAAFCLSPTACIGIPVTCWLLFILSRPEVRKSFEP